ncbi:NUDIX domain [Acidipropionibacterium jensenii]|uniref:NUDIX domain n=1 Tax=Acidipropionibacterium jensenii TaxID=1749 RepID=A0A3S4UVY8_9ACTN|nr:NUDIX domain-containing protein [Acidipropionibacterium jensenii]QCV88883.1 NUDIX domain-containing protein [Acidipropionibacterium jensenii]VEI02096.1 NUDIX domain [Acidipropionibacterium jensenii]
MRIDPPAPGAPRRPHGPRDPGDAWVVTDSGEKFWGVYGAAGLLAVDPQRGVLLQHRVGWSHFGGTWGIPGGARHKGETGLEGALRESGEEAGVPRDAVRPRCLSVLDRKVWSYLTVLADVVRPFEPRISDAESLELRWVPLDDVAGFDLHPGFKRSWPAMRQLLQIRPVLVVNCSSVTDPGLVDAVEQRGVGAAQLGLPGTAWFPEVVRVGDRREAVARALSLAETSPYVTMVGDDEVFTGELVGAGARVRTGDWLAEIVAEREAGTGI